MDLMPIVSPLSVSILLLSRRASDLIATTLLGAIEDDRAHGLDPGLLQRYLAVVRSKLPQAVLATPQSVEAGQSQLAEQPRSPAEAD